MISAGDANISDDTRDFGDFDEAGALDYDEVARTIFAPIYPPIAARTIEVCGIREGICIEAGSGPAYLAIEMARQTQMAVYALDVSPYMSPIAWRNVENAGMIGRVTPVVGDVKRMPFPDNFADLVISRGSMFAWKDLGTSFAEILRVLKPVGSAYLGVGLGPTPLGEKVSEQLRSRNIGRGKKDWPGKMKLDEEAVQDDLKRAGIVNYSATHDDAGYWLYFKK
jgi:ubiquinone/menaquinone biosynthesis C-methylase UbiE